MNRPSGISIGGSLFTAHGLLGVCVSAAAVAVSASGGGVAVGVLDGVVVGGIGVFVGGMKVGVGRTGTGVSTVGDVKITVKVTLGIEVADGVGVPIGVTKKM
jgi:hypothetical protein